MSERYDLMTARKVGDKTYWTKIGIMFPNRNGPGFRLSFEALPIPTLYDGKVEVAVMAFPPKERDGGTRSNAPQTTAGRSAPLDDDVPF